MGIGQQFRNGFHVVDPVLGWDLDLPSFTCAHCNRVQAPGLTQPMNDRWPQEKLDRAILDWKRDTAVCRKCDANVCRFCAVIDGECNSIKRDAALAFDDVYKQPWMLRQGGQPVRRVLDNEGHPILVLAKDIGYTDREMANIGGQLNYDGTAKWEAGERIL